MFGEGVAIRCWVGCVPLPAGGPVFAPPFPQPSSWRSPVVRTGGRNWWAGAAAMLAVASAWNEPQSPEQRRQLLLTDGSTLAVDATTTFALPDVSSTGSMDPDGYTAWVDGSTSQPVGTNGVVMFSGLAAGDHEVALYGIAPNCAVSTPDKGANNPRGVSILAGVGGSADFSLACGSWGELFVSTNTTGVDLPAGGYTVSVDGGASQTIAANGANQGTVTVPAGGTGAATFAVTCVVPGSRASGTGQLGMGAATPHNNVQTFNFDVRADLTGKFYITAYDDIHPDGTIATVFVDASADPATFFKAYRTSSNACSDPSHGVEFDALGRDGPDLVNVTGIVCDDGAQGSGRDFFSFFIIKPQAAGIGRSGMVTSGDIVKN